MPSDFDILSLLPLDSSIIRCSTCTQNRENGLPVAPSLCAISFSWCGKIRSTPPAWMSIGASPSRRSAIAEHSMCHPGRPGPIPESQVGSPCFRRLPHDEVAGVFLVVLVAVDARAALDAGVIEARELAVLGERGDLEVDRPVASIGVPALFERADRLPHRLDVLGVGRARALLDGLQAERRGVLAVGLRRSDRCTRAAARRPSATRGSSGRPRR